MMFYSFTADAQNYFLAGKDSLRDKATFDSLLLEYQGGKKNYSILPAMIAKSKALKNDSLGTLLAEDYIENYLMKVNSSDRLTKQNISFINAHLHSHQSNAFIWFDRNRVAIDIVMDRKGYASETLTNVLASSFITPHLQAAIANHRDPNWQLIRKAMRKKASSDLVDMALLDAKIRWSGYHKNWLQHTKHIVQRVEKYGPFGMFSPVDWRYNDNAWTIFLKSNNQDEIKKALVWCDSAIRIAEQPEYYDTYANLLYKLGRVEEAIKMEEKAAFLGPNYDDIKLNLEKMKKGQPTWPLEL